MFLVWKYLHYVIYSENKNKNIEMFWLLRRGTAIIFNIRITTILDYSKYILKV